MGGESRGRLPRFRRSGRSGRAFPGLAAGMVSTAAKLFGEAALASAASTGSVRSNVAQVTVTIETLMTVRAGTFSAGTMCPGQADHGGGRGTARRGRCVRQVNGNVPQLLAGGPDAWRYPAHCNLDGMSKWAGRSGRRSGQRLASLVREQGAR